MIHDLHRKHTTKGKLTKLPHLKSLPKDAECGGNFYSLKIVQFTE